MQKKLVLLEKNGIIKNIIGISGYVGELKVRTARGTIGKKARGYSYECRKRECYQRTLGRKQLTKLKVFAGENHGHEAQKPQLYEIKS